MATIEVKVPDIGDFKDVEVIEVLVKTGDRVAVEQSLITVESDKASMEIPSSAAGVVKALRVKLGDKVSEGVVLLELEADASSTAAAQPEAAPSASVPAAGPEGQAASVAAAIPPAAAGVGFASEPRQHTPPTAALAPVAPAPSATHLLPHASPSVA